MITEKSVYKTAASYKYHKANRRKFENGSKKGKPFYIKYSE